MRPSISLASLALPFKCPSLVPREVPLKERASEASEQAATGSLPQPRGLILPSFKTLLPCVLPFRSQQISRWQMALKLISPLKSHPN